MKNKVLKVAVIMALIVVLTISDFILVGMNIAKAIGNIEDATNHENVKFSAYFKTEEGKQVSQKDYQIDNSEMKLYLQIAVKNEGYFDGVITLENSNFKLKQEILSDGISSIEENKITLNRVRAGNAVEIELGIEPIIEESYGSNMLNQKSLLKIAGQYKDSTEKSISIESGKEVALNLTAPSNLETEVSSYVITNKVYKIGEENKKIIQIEINSQPTKNAYPVKKSSLEVALPEGVEKVQVISKGTYATNGQADRVLEGYTVENNTLKIAIENESKDGKISWKKDAIDNVIITLQLPEDVEVAEEYSAKSKIEFLGSEGKVIEKELTYSLEQESDGLVMASIKNNETIYKGKIYSKENREYNTTTNLEINYANVVENSLFVEKSTYKTEKQLEFKVANINYKTTTISKAEIEKILGQEGSLLTIKDQNGNVVQEITKDTQADENGNIVVTYQDGVKELTIEVAKAIATGIIRLNHTKVIKPENYTVEEIKGLKSIVEYVGVEHAEPAWGFGPSIELKETSTVAEVVVDRQTLSTAAVNEQVKIAVTLKTDNEKYDLYKNPTITIKLPNDLKTVSNIKAVPLYLDNFTINTEYNAEAKEIKIKLNGEQTQYNLSSTNGYIEVFADMEFDEMVPSREDNITVTYTNEKAIAYENNGTVAVPVKISGFSGLVAYNSIANNNLKTNSVNTSKEQIGNLKMYEPASEADFAIALINNTSADLSNVKVLGNLPVKGNVKVGEYTFENTIDAKLKSEIDVAAGTATIYYTNNANATLDLAKAENGWNTNVAEVENPVLYMVLIPNMAKGTNFIANYTMSIPANLENDKEMKSTYVAYYETEPSDATVEVLPVGLETGKVLVTLEGTVGTEKLENNAVVKAGEVIRYKVTVENTGSVDAKNVEISSLVPEGTTLVEPSTEEGKEFWHIYGTYYKELDATAVEGTIDVLQSKQTKTFEYEVRVKSDVTLGTIKNQTTVIYNEGVEVKSNTLANQLEASNIRVTVKRLGGDAGGPYQLMAGSIGEYQVIVENISNTEQKDINIKFNMPSEEVAKLNYIEELHTEVLETKNEWTIDSIPAGESRLYNLFLEIEQITEANIKANLNAVATQNNIKYRSNVYTETLYGIDLEMKMTSPNEGEYLETDELIEYNIEIKNNSEISFDVMFVDNIPEQLSIQKIEINSNYYEENILDNSFVRTIILEKNSITTIKIYTIVNYDRARLENETITNVAKVVFLGEELASTQSVSHIIESIVIKEEEPGQNPDNPEQPGTPENPNNPEQPGKPEDPGKPENPGQTEKKKFSISGKAWVDQNKDGEMNAEDTILESIKVKLLNIETNEFVRDAENKKDLVVETDKNGNYEFKNITEGNYIVVFEYDKTLYKPTTYQKENVVESKNSNVVSKTLTINGEEKEYAITDQIELNKNTANINMGLVFTKQFDVELDKYISKVIVQTSKDTVTYEYENKDFAKVDINPKRMVGSTILVQYTIKVKNIGDVDAYVNSIVDYLPAGFKFSSELNKDWYEQGTDLYTNCLENTAIAPGETKEVNLVLTKTKTDGNAELINNMAEVHDAYNIYGIADTNSEVGNKNKEENDFGSADLMISIQTGTVFNYIALVISMLGVIGVAAYLINKKIINIKL